MNIKDKFKIAVIEAIHKKPYKDAVKIEAIHKSQKVVCGECGRTLYKDMYGNYNCGNVACDPLGTPLETIDVYYPRQITIGRVMKALINKYKGNFYSYWDKNNELKICCQFWTKDEVEFEWKLTDEYGRECTDEDQEEKTLKKLLNLLTK